MGFENSFEKIGKISDEAGESELADVVERESEWQKEQRILFVKLVEQVSNEFLTFSEAVDKAETNSLEEIKNRTQVDLVKFQDSFSKALPQLFKKMIDLFEEGRINLIGGNSFSDVKNSIIGSAMWISYFDKKLRNEKKLNDDLLDAFKKSFQSEYLPYYIDAIYNDNEKLILELSQEEGFLYKYKKYFKEIPTGTNKLPCFKFFSELEKGNFNIENLEFELNNLEEKLKGGLNIGKKGIEINYLDKEKIIEDFSVSER